MSWSGEQPLQLTLCALVVERALGVGTAQSPAAWAGSRMGQLETAYCSDCNMV